MKKILILEDDFVHIDIIYRALQKAKFKLYPEIKGNKDPMSSFVTKCSLYVINRKDDMLVKEDLKKYIRETVMKNDTPDLLIVDISLRNQGYRSFDNDGGIIRKEVLSELYIDVPCIFLTGWVNQVTIPYKMRNDDYVAKFKDGEKNFKYVIEDDLIYKIKKSLNIL